MTTLQELPPDPDADRERQIELLMDTAGLPATDARAAVDGYRTDVENPNLTGLLQTIGETSHNSGLRGARRQIVRAAIDGSIGPNEVDAAFGALKARRATLTWSGEELPYDMSESGQPQATEEPWTPSSVLGTLPRGQRPADHAERQMPAGDREEHVDYS